MNHLTPLPSALCGQLAAESVKRCTPPGETSRPNQYRMPCVFLQPVALASVPGECRVVGDWIAVESVPGNGSVQSLSDEPLKSQPWLSLPHKERAAQVGIVQC